MVQKDEETGLAVDIPPLDFVEQSPYNVYIASSAQLNSIAERNCDLMIASFSFLQTYVAFPIMKNSPYMTDFDKQ